jgi:DNA polymerase III subunit delta'
MMEFNIYPWQESQWQKMNDSIESGRLAHALLLTGPSGVGIDQFANALAGNLLCRDKNNNHACGECKSCVLLRSDNHPDFFRIEPEEQGKQIKVDDIRTLIEFIHLSSQYSSNKIVIVTPAEAMNRNAANSLLKTLEEPPEGVIFLLVTSQASRLPITIRSRCQKLGFSKAPQDIGISWLQDVAGLSSDKALELLEMTMFRPLDALELIESNITLHRNEVLSDLQKLGHHSSDTIGIAKKWHDYGALEVFRWLLEFISCMSRLKLTGSDNSSGISRDLQQITNQLHLTQLVNCYDMAIQNYQAASAPYNINRTGLLEDFIIYWQSQKNIQENKK